MYLSTPDAHCLGPFKLQLPEPQTNLQAALRVLELHHSKVTTTKVNSSQHQRRRKYSVDHDSSSKTPTSETCSLRFSLRGPAFKPELKLQTQLKPLLCLPSEVMAQLSGFSDSNNATLCEGYILHLLAKNLSLPPRTLSSSLMEPYFDFL